MLRSSAQTFQSRRESSSKQGTEISEDTAVLSGRAMSSQRRRSESLRGRECDGHRQVLAVRRLLIDNMLPLGKGTVWKTGRYRSLPVLLQFTVCDLIQIQPEQVVWMCTQAALDISFRGDKPEKKPKTFQLDRLSLFKRPEIDAAHFLRRYFDLGEHRGGIDNDCSSNLNTIVVLK